MNTPYTYNNMLFFFSVFNLANDVDVEDTKRQIEIYKRENADLIKKNRTKLVCFCDLQNMVLNEETF